MKKLLYLVVLLLMPLAGWSQTAVITGTAVGIGQTLTLPVTLQVQLVGCSPDVPRLIPSGSVITNNFSVTAAPITFIATATVYGNNIVTCNNQSYSTYAVTWNVNGRPAAPTQNYRVVEGQTCNISDGSCKPIGFYPAVIQNATGSMCAAGFNLQGYNSNFVPQCVQAPAVGPTGPAGPAGGANLPAGVNSLIKGNGTINQIVAATPGVDYPGLATANTYAAIQNLSAGLNVTGGTSTFSNGFAVTAGTPTFAAGLNVTGGTATLPGGYTKTTSATTQNITQATSTSLNVNYFNGQINAAFFCATPFVLDQTCLENAAAIANGATIFMPAGTYTGTLSTINRSNLHIVLDANASLNYVLNIQGIQYTRTASVTVTGSFPPGTTTFSGNFSGYTPGQNVVIEQGVGGSIPTDFGVVQTASGTQLVLTTGVRFTYGNPIISLITGAVHAGVTVPTYSNTISGNYTATFAAGDMIRIENMTATDSPRGNAFYFEFARVASITTSAITLETAVRSAFGTPWLVKLNLATNISIDGGQGFIQNAGVRFARQVSIQNLNTNVLNAEYLYDAQLNHLHGNANNATGGAFYWTYIFNGSISNVNTFGGQATADSGNIQLVSLQGVTVTNVSSWQGTDTVQGSYPFDMDYVFTPYEVPNAFDTIAGIAVGTSQSTATGFSVFMAGLKGTSVSGLSTTGSIVMLDGFRATLNNINAAGSLQLNSGSAYMINNFAVDSMAIGVSSAVSNSIFSNFTIAGGPTQSANSALVVFAGSNDRFVHGEFTQSNLTIDTIQAQANSTQMYYQDIQDHTGTNLSFSLFTNGTGTHELIGNRFASGVQVPFITATISGIPSIGTPVVNSAACIKTVGPPVVLGYCSTVVAAGGTCTCN